MTDVSSFSKRVSVTKIFTFDSAHRLDDYVGKCANLHGHTYRLEVEMKGVPDYRGIVVDFGDIKQIVNEEIISKYDHQFLNELLPFNTTAENMVGHFFEIIDNRLQKTTDTEPVELQRVRLWETPTSYAEMVREDFYSESK
ncbi:MAG: queD [Bacilli bacterium]|nr:queD [Bacilli bacterium]